MVQDLGCSGFVKRESERERERARERERHKGRERERECVYVDWAWVRRHSNPRALTVLLLLYSKACGDALFARTTSIYVPNPRHSALHPATRHLNRH